MAQNDGFIPPITTEPLADGVRYRLPKRQLGSSGVVGFWVVFGFGLVMTVFMVFWMQGPIRSALRNGLNGFGDWFSLGFGLLGLPGLAVGLGLILFAFWVIWGRTLIEVRSDRMHVVDKLGPIGWRRKRPIEVIRKIEVHGKMRLVETEGGEANQEMRMTGLKIVCEGAKPMHIYCGTTGEQTQQLAETLAAELDLAAPDKLVSDKTFVEVIEVDDDEDEDEAVRDQKLAARQPSDSPIVVDRSADGLSLTIPPLGVFKNKAGLFSFGILWCGFMAFFTVAMLWGGFKGEGDAPTAEGWGGIVMFALFGLLFWGIGIGMLVAGWNMGRRRTVIDVVGDTLLFTQVAPLGQKQYEWQADQIKSLAFGPSGMESNDVPIMCILVEPQDGKTRKLLTGRDEPELQWLAAVLRTHLQLSD